MDMTMVVHIAVGFVELFLDVDRVAGPILDVNDAAHGVGLASELAAQPVWSNLGIGVSEG